MKFVSDAYEKKFLQHEFFFCAHEKGANNRAPDNRPGARFNSGRREAF